MTKQTYLGKTSKGNKVYESIETWGITRIVKNEQGEIVDSWDGKASELPVRFMVAWHD